MEHLLVILILFAWGIAGIFDKKAVQTNTGKTVFATFHLFNVPLLVFLFTMLTLGGSWTLNHQLLFWQSLSGLCGISAVLLYLLAMSKTEASYVIGITAGYPVISQLLAVPLLGEKLSLWGLTSAALVGLGVALIGSSARSSSPAGIKDATTPGLSSKQLAGVLITVLTATLFWGAIGVFEKKAVSYGKPLEAYFAESMWELIFALIALGIFTLQKTPLHLRKFATWKFSWLSALGVAIGNYLVLILFSRETASYAIVITACYPLIMYFAALIWLGERLNKVRLLGIVLVIVGGVLCELLR